MIGVVPRRLLVYDRTCAAPIGLGSAWTAGARLFRAVGRLDDAYGAASWGEALAWLAGADEPIAELQYWGHGKWGCAMIDGEPLDAAALSPAHALHRGLEALRARLAPGALVWFRTCETFGARRGLDFAERLAGWLGARVDGHTYVIGFHQSGLHGLRPGERPGWAADHGLADGTADAPRRARRSRPWAPRTITCLARGVPAAWFDADRRSAVAG
jgi:hypothetical protein